MGVRKTASSLTALAKGKKHQLKKALKNIKKAKDKAQPAAKVVAPTRKYIDDFM